MHKAALTSALGEAHRICAIAEPDELDVDFSPIRTDETPATLGGSDQKAGVRDGASAHPTRMSPNDPWRQAATPRGKTQPEIEAPKWLLSYK